MNVSREPVVTVNMILSVLRSGLLMLLALDVMHLSDSQLEAVMAFAAAVSLVVDAIATLWVRGQVTPLAKFPSERVRRAIRKGKHHRVKVRSEEHRSLVVPPAPPDLPDPMPPEAPYRGSMR